MAYSLTKTDRYRNIMVYNGDSSIFNQTMVLTTTRSGSKVLSREDKIRACLPAGSTYTTSARRLEKRQGGDVFFKWSPWNSPGTTITDTLSGVSDDVSGASFNHLSLPTAEAENESLMKILRKIRSESSHMNGLTVLGELRKTIQGLRHPYQTMRDQVYSHLNTLSKRKRELLGYPPVKRQKAWRQILADTWLETAFGLQPVISDTKSIAESIARFQFEPPVRVRLQSNARRFNRSVNRGTAQSFGFGYFFSRSQTVIESQVGCRYTVGMELAQDANYGACDRLRKILGFTPENFVPTLYEIMPWSWLIDYFSNIGDIIEAATTSTVNVRWIVKSTKIESLYDNDLIIELAPMKASLSSGGNFFRSSNIEAGPFSSSRVRYATLTRTCPVSLGTPTFQFENPFSSLGKMANMGAILTQFSGRDFEPSWAHKLPNYRR